MPSPPSALPPPKKPAPPLPPPATAPSATPPQTPQDPLSFSLFHPLAHDDAEAPVRKRMRLEDPPQKHVLSVFSVDPPPPTDSIIDAPYLPNPLPNRLPTPPPHYHPSPPLPMPVTATTSNHTPSHRNRRPHSHEQTTATSHAKDSRKLWNQSAFEREISPSLKAALLHFIHNVPPIPTHHDPSKDKYVRNMRGWIVQLARQENQPVWLHLINVLRLDTSAKELCGDHWDHDLCRYILGILVAGNQPKQSNNSESKQSRQAVNNAIKRELDCPTETGKSSRGKTFRDLFREKCQAANVDLPDLFVFVKTHRKSRSHPQQSPDRPPDNTPGQNSSSDPHSAHHPQKNHTTGGDTSYASGQPMSELHAPPGPPNALDHLLHKLRMVCPRRDEWGRTAWWHLPEDDHVKQLPELLAFIQPFELQRLVLDFRWIVRTFRCVNFLHGMRQIPTLSYDLLLNRIHTSRIRCSPFDIEGFRLIRDALMLILPILSLQPSSNVGDKTFIAHLATQLFGRLVEHKRRFPNVGTLIHSIETHAPRPWLRPLTRCFQQPRTNIRIAVPGNGNQIPYLIALSEDGTLLATSGVSRNIVKPEPQIEMTFPPVVAKDQTNIIHNQRRPRRFYSTKIWDVSTGREVCELPRTDVFIRHLSIARNNSCIISETVDGLYFWHLIRDTKPWRTKKVEASPRLKSVSAISPMPHGKRVLTTHRMARGSVIALWDMESGHRLTVFDAVKSSGNCIDVSARGDYFSSGHDNGFIHLWSLKDKLPVLSFKNEGSAKGPQQVVSLAEVNKTVETQQRTISVSFYEKGKDRWLTAISTHAKKLEHKSEIIRVWQLPPQDISSEYKGFVLVIRSAVFMSPQVREVQWSQKERFFTGGDDGVARMYKRLDNEKWEVKAIDNENGERSSNLSSVLVSCGKKSQLVATYVTLSPYVTVWDMSDERGMRQREKLYRPYLPALRNSIDAADIRQLTWLSGIDNPLQPADMRPESRFMDVGDALDARSVRRKLGDFFFQRMEKKEETKTNRDLPLWLTVQVEGHQGASGPGAMMRVAKKPLVVCFEQPVITGESGLFKEDECEELGAVKAICNANTLNASRSWKKGGRRGMVAALQNGSIAIFELEERGGRSDVEGLVIKEETKVEVVGEAAVNAEGNNVKGDANNEAGEAMKGVETANTRDIGQ